MQDEEKYIEERRKKAEKLSFKFRVCGLLPIKQNKVVFSAFEGDGGFGCNPKYIAEELHRKDESLQMVWLTHEPSRWVFPDYIKVVKDTDWNTAYHLSTAKIWVDNYRKPWGTVKRSGQYYFQTWHASIGFKAVGLYRGDKFPKIARIVSQADSDLIDYMIINSDYCEKVYPKKLLYSGKMLKFGSPRCDCLFEKRKEYYTDIRKRFGLKEDVKIMMYAPTFRGGNQKGKKHVVAEAPSIDFAMLEKALKEKFSGEWVFFLRLHPQLSAQLKEMPLLKSSEKIIDVSQEPDMSELLAASDVLITDYSSCAFDAAFGHIPVFLYADDIQEYIENRGEFMWKREELPFSIAENNMDLIENIYSFTEKEYLDSIQQFINENGVFENGNAGKNTADYISNYINL